MFVNGELCSAPDRTLFDRIGEDSVYEVIKLLEGVPLFFEDHMDRLHRSIKLQGIKIDISHRRVRNEINCLTEKTGCYNVNVKLVWYPAVEKSMFLTYCVQQDIPAVEAYRQGVHTILFDGERKNPHVKSVKTSYRDRAATARKAAGAYEALLVDDNGYISEGTRSNIFYLIDNHLCTPPSGSVLLGVTRQHVMDLCRELGISVRQRKLHRNDLERLEGVFITGTSIDVLPVGSIERARLASASHPAIEAIAKAFNRHVVDYVAKNTRNKRSSS
jgi:branched-chain amino acid aminotransferase